MSQQSLFTSYPGIILHFGKNIDSQQKESFFSLINKKKIPYYVLHHDEFDVSIANLINKLEEKYQNGKSQLTFVEEKNYKLIGQTHIQENILWFSGYSRQEVEDLLTTLRDEKYPRFHLKAVATKNNQLFNFAKLIRELREDRTVISHVITLRNQIKKAEDYISKNISLENKKLIENLQDKIKQSELLLDDIENSFNLNQFQKHINCLQNLLE